MASTISWCLNLPPQPQLSSIPSSNSKARQIPWKNNDNNNMAIITRTESLVGLACAVVIGLELCCCEGSMAAISRRSTPATIVKSSTAEKVLRWSDKRVCPPWILNSLETIVPENLPRPLARRRLETVGSSVKGSKTGDEVKLIVKMVNNNGKRGKSAPLVFIEGQISPSSVKSGKTTLQVTFSEQISPCH